MKVSNEEVLQAFQTIGRLLEEVYGVKKEKLLLDDSLFVPAHIFRSKLSPFSTISTYLAQEGLGEKEIAKLLNRNKSFVRSSIKEAKLQKSGTRLPVEIFQGDLSVLEASVNYLAGKGFDNAKIADELGKTTSAVWTLLKRVEVKLGSR